MFPFFRQENDGRRKKEWKKKATTKKARVRALFCFLFLFSNYCGTEKREKMDAITADDENDLGKTRDYARKKETRNEKKKKKAAVDAFCSARRKKNEHARGASHNLFFRLKLVKTISRRFRGRYEAVFSP